MKSEIRNSRTIKSANNIRDLNYYECPNCHEPQLYHGKEGITCYNCGTKVDENDLNKLKIWVSPHTKIRNSRTIKSEFEIGDDVIVTDESQDLNEVEGTVTDIVDDRAEVVFKSGEDSWVDLDKIESACHGKSKKDKKKKSIKSSLDEKTYQEFKEDMFHAISEVYKKYNFNTGMNADREDFDKVIEWMDIHGYWDDDEDSMM